MYRRDEDANNILRRQREGTTRETTKVEDRC